MYKQLQRNYFIIKKKIILFEFGEFTDCSRHGQDSENSRAIPENDSAASFLYAVQFIWPVRLRTNKYPQKFQPLKFILDSENNNLDLWKKKAPYDPQKEELRRRSGKEQRENHHNLTQQSCRERPRPRRRWIQRRRTVGSAARSGKWRRRLRFRRRNNPRLPYPSLRNSRTSYAPRTRIRRFGVRLSLFHASCPCTLSPPAINQIKSDSVPKIY